MKSKVRLDQNDYYAEDQDFQKCPQTRGKVLIGKLENNFEEVKYSKLYVR